MATAWESVEVLRLLSVRLTGQRRCISPAEIVAMLQRALSTVQDTQKYLAAIAYSTQGSGSFSRLLR